MLRFGESSTATICSLRSLANVEFSSLHQLKGISTAKLCAYKNLCLTADPVLPFSTVSLKGLLNLFSNLAAASFFGDVDELYFAMMLDNTCDSLFSFSTHKATAWVLLSLFCFILLIILECVRRMSEIVSLSFNEGNSLIISSLLWSEKLSSLRLILIVLLLSTGLWSFCFKSILFK